MAAMAAAPDRFLCLYRRDWLEGEMESDRILSRAEHQISVESHYLLEPQDSGWSEFVAGILQFAKSNPKDTSNESLFAVAGGGEEGGEDSLEK